MRARENFGRASAPRLPQAVQTKSGSMSDSLIGPALGTDRDVVAAAVIAAIDQHIADAGCAHFAEDDFLRAGGHMKSGHCNSGQLSLASFSRLDGRVPAHPGTRLQRPTASVLSPTGAVRFLTTVLETRTVASPVARTTRH